MKRWYVIQVYAGYEDAIKAEMLKRIEEYNLAAQFGQILIPSAKVKHFFEAGGALEDQQLFPGYMLIEMEATPEAKRLVSSTPRVVRFLGGKDPVPLSQKEIDRIIGQISGAVTLAVEKHEFETGKEVEIIDGPFSGFSGLIEAIDENSEKLTVMVSIFGRMTPVELQFDQVKH